MEPINEKEFDTVEVVADIPKSESNKNAKNENNKVEETKEIVVFDKSKIDYADVVIMPPMINVDIQGYIDQMIKWYNKSRPEPDRYHVNDQNGTCLVVNDEGFENDSISIKPTQSANELLVHREETGERSVLDILKGSENRNLFSLILRQKE